MKKNRRPRVIGLADGPYQPLLVVWGHRIEDALRVRNLWCPHYNLCLTAVADTLETDHSRRRKAKRFAEYRTWRCAQWCPFREVREFPPELLELAHLQGAQRWTVYNEDPLEGGRLQLPKRVGDHAVRAARLARRELIKEIAVRAKARRSGARDEGAASLAAPLDVEAAPLDEGGCEILTASEASSMVGDAQQTQPSQQRGDVSAEGVH